MSEPLAHPAANSGTPATTGRLPIIRNEEQALAEIGYVSESEWPEY